MKTFLRIFADFWIAIFMLTLSLLFTLAYQSGTRISFNMVIEVFLLPGWGILGLFFAVSMVLFIVRLPWQLRALALVPVIVYAAAVPFAYSRSGGELLTGLVAGHLYGGMAITMMLQIGVLNSNHEKDQRDRERHSENQRLLGQIDVYRKLVDEARGGLPQGTGNGAE